MIVNKDYCHVALCIMLIIVTEPEEYKQSEWGTEFICDYRLFYRHFWVHYVR